MIDISTGDQRHRIRVTGPEAPIGSAVRLDEGRVVLGPQQPDRLWGVDLTRTKSVS